MWNRLETVRVATFDRAGFYVVCVLLCETWLVFSVHDVKFMSQDSLSCTKSRACLPFCVKTQEALHNVNISILFIMIARNQEIVFGVPTRLGTTTQLCFKIVSNKLMEKTADQGTHSRPIV